MKPETELLLTKWLADGSRLSDVFAELPDSELDTVSDQIVALQKLVAQERQRRRKLEKS